MSWRRKLLMQPLPHAIATFDVANAGDEIRIIGYVAYKENIKYMFVDGAPASPTTWYTFSTAGLHTIKYYYQDVRNIPDVAFQQCDRLVDVHFAKGIRSIGTAAFKSCSMFEMDVSLFPKSLTTIGSDAFRATRSRGIIDLPLLQGTNILWGNGASSGTANLIQGIRTPGDYNESAVWGCMGGMTSLKFVCLSPMTSIIPTYLFFNCSSLQAVKIPYRGVVSLANAALERMSGANPYFYVPDALVDTYKADSQWSSRASYIKPISQWVEPSID